MGAAAVASAATPAVAGAAASTASTTPVQATVLVGEAALGVARANAGANSSIVHFESSEMVFKRCQSRSATSIKTSGEQICMKICSPDPFCS